MQKKNKQIKAARPVVLLLVCILILSSFSVAYATSLGKHNSAFTLLHNKMDSSPDQTYPYDTENAQITQVGFDVLYGTKRDLIEYFGEVPYKNTWDGDKRVDGWNGYYAKKGTPDITSEDYWGKTGITKNDKVSVEQLEKVNTENEVKSLRLHALHISPVAFWHWLGNAWYIVMSTFAWLGSKIISLLVAAKNIDMNGILKAFNLQKVSEAVNKSLVFNPDAGEHGQISILAAVCIVMFMLSIAGCVIHYVKGRKKEKDLVTGVLLPAFLGAVITMMALSGRINTIGSIFADGVNNVMYEITAMTTDTSGGDVFITKITDSKNTGKVVQIQEMGLINKCYIDMQICTQFKASGIAELKLDKFGTAASSNIGTLQGVSSATDFSSEFGNNIGYYFWFANSSAAEKTKSNKTYPATKAMVAEDKVESLITWMQKTYNSSSTTQAQKNKILNSLEGLAAPDSGAGGARMFLFTIVMIILALCLWRYVRDILLAKIQLLVGLLGMAVAGPMLITGNKKMINTGKDILAIVLLSFIEITIHSVMFDVIIYATSVIIGPTWEQLFVTIALLLLLFKFNKKLNEKIHELCHRIENSVMSSGSPVKTFRNKLTSAVRDTPHKWAVAAANAYDKTSTVDENGIARSNAGDLKSRMLRGLANTTAKSDQTESMLKINSDYNKARKESGKAYEAERAKFAADKVANIENGINEDAAKRFKELETLRIHEINKAMEDTSSMTEEEKRLAKRREHIGMKMNEAKNERDTLMKSSKSLEDKVAKGEQLSEDETAKLTDYRDQINAINENIEKLADADAEASVELRASITSRVQVDFNNKNLTESERKALEQTKGNLENAIKLDTQQSAKYKDKLKDALTEQQTLANEQMDTLVEPEKIGGHKTVNVQAVSTANVTALKLAELERGLIVDSTEEAERLTADVTEFTRRELEFNIAKNEKKQEFKETAQDIKNMPKDLRQKAIDGTKNNNKVTQIATKAGTNEIVRHTQGAANVASGAVNAAGTVVAAKNEAGKVIENRFFGDDISKQAKEHRDSALDGILAAKQAGVAPGQIKGEVTVSSYAQRTEAKKAEKKEQRETKREERREKAEERRSERSFDRDDRREAREEKKRERQEEKERKREERQMDRDEWTSSRREHREEPSAQDYSSMASQFEQKAAQTATSTPEPQASPEREVSFQDLLGQDQGIPGSDE